MLSEEFGKNYTVESCDACSTRCARRRHRVAFVVYGLINFELYFKGREEAERLRESDTSRYPHLETSYKYLLSFHPDYRRNLIRLASMVNEELRTMVEELKRELRHGKHPVAIFRCVGDSGPQPRGVTPSN